MYPHYPSIFNDVIGPVMRGPSSSHTAASWRIARTCLDILNEPLKKGSAKGVVWKRDELIPKYYELRGWDNKGVPTKEKLSKLRI